MVDKTFKIHYIQFDDDIKSVVLNANTPINAIKNSTSCVDTVNDQPFEPFKDEPPIVTPINNEPVDAAPLDGLNNIVNYKCNINYIKDKNIIKHTITECMYHY